MCAFCNKLKISVNSEGLCQNEGWFWMTLDFLVFYATFMIRGKSRSTTENHVYIMLSLNPRDEI